MVFVKTQGGSRLINLREVQEIWFYKNSQGHYILIADTPEKDYTIGKYKKCGDAQHALDKIAKQIGAAEAPESETCYTDQCTLKEFGETCKILGYEGLTDIVAEQFGVETLGELADMCIYIGCDWDGNPKLTWEGVKASEKILTLAGYQTKEDEEGTTQSPENIKYWQEREKKESEENTHAAD